MTFSKYLLLSGCLLLMAHLPAQRLDYKLGQLIVQLRPTADIKDLVQSMPAITHAEVAAKALNAHILFFDPSIYAATDMKQRLTKRPEVLIAQLNRLVNLRSTLPNDSQFNQQWQFRNTGQSGGTAGADFNICAAWDHSTGGLTPNGDTIVVCVIDNGIDPTHPDLRPNLWINHHEIPNNGIDDDNNGYIDDYQGWNSANNNSDINGGPHGTSVAGIVGARGNNNLGVTGVNWTTKVMIVNNRFFAAESEVLKAYSYALDARILYNSTQGEKGAYVVATNASWGIDNGNVEDSPIWCSLYDLLGELGILSAGAPQNANVDVDIVGDLPTNCPSDFLLGVTSVNHNDIKTTGAAFGVNSIELGAYGENVFTIRNNGTYGSFTGTSAATPAVAGAIGLLYSAPNPAFGEILAADPVYAALLVKNIILSTVKPLPSLANVTVSGGVLNIGQAMEAMMDISLSCLAPLTIRIEPNSTNGLLLTWNTLSLVNNVELRYRPQGSSEWNLRTDLASPYTLTGLNSCTTYEIQLTSRCAEENQSSEIITATTEGCCLAPTDLQVSNLSSSSVLLQWEAILAARSYHLRYRPQGSTPWIEQTTAGNSLTLVNLQACTTYELALRSDCDTILTDFGPAQIFLTAGCGACLDLDYCLPAPPDNSEEWIELFDLGGRVVNVSGANVGGYINFGELQGSTLARGGLYPIRLQPGHIDRIFTESFKIWVDWDQNGFFTSNEQIGAAISSGGAMVTIPLDVPLTAPLGLPRMRVVMEFSNAQSSCNTLVRDGEVEDYCLRIIESPGCVPPDQLIATYFEETGSIRLDWPASLAQGGEYVVRYRRRNSSEWTSVTTTELSLTLDNFPLCDLYDAQVASTCAAGQGAFVSTLFNSCSSNEETSLPAAAWQLSPNPSQGVLLLTWSDAISPTSVQLFNSLGQTIALPPIPGGARQLRYELSNLPIGLYWLRLNDQSGRSATKRWLKN